MWNLNQPPSGLGNMALHLAPSLCLYIGRAKGILGSNSKGKEVMQNQSCTCGVLAHGGCWLVETDHFVVLANHLLQMLGNRMMYYQEQLRYYVLLVCLRWLNSSLRRVLFADSKSITNFLYLKKNSPTVVSLHTMH